MTTIYDQLETILGIDGREEPLLFCVTVVVLLYIVKNIFGMLYSFINK